MSPLDLLKEYGKLYTPAVSDAIDALGLSDGWVSHELRPVWAGARCAGHALTVKMVDLAPGEKFEEKQYIQQFSGMMKEVKRGSLIALDMSGSMAAAGWGQVTSKMAQDFGCTGAVVDGPARDIPRIAELKFPVFARGVVASSIRGRIKPVAVQTEVRIGGRRVRPGDLLFADINGVVVVPKEHIEPVLKRSQEIISVDKWWVEQLNQGRHPLDIEKEHPLP